MFLFVEPFRTSESKKIFKRKIVICVTNSLLWLQIFRGQCQPFGFFILFHLYWSESMEWIIENQAFFRSYNSAPRPNTSPVRKLSLFLSFPVYRRSHLRSKGGGGGGGRGTKSYNREKASPSIMFQYSLCIGIDMSTVSLHCFLLESFWWWCGLNTSGLEDCLFCLLKL